ncbi:MAG: alpha/beta fold hydrolase [Anaerolineales bacterium]|nr:alpha/beta fold hydrolase [Anaerolineales bacterium]MCB8937109.1 alpha/beta fold hydrolase [Ardenticatenaceae bacterium]
MEPYTEGTFSVGTQEIHYVEAGKKGRQIALLIHGWSSSWYATSPLLGQLAQRFHVIAIDLPGYGQSPPLEIRTTIPHYVDLLADLIGQISDGPVVLVGHSMGGMISVTLALTHPILVERMVLLSPTISGRLSTAINLFISPITMMERFGLGSLVVSATERAFVGLTDRLMRPVSFAERTGITEGDYERLRMDARRPGQGRVRAECFRAMLENDLSGRLGQIETPSLVIWGAEDNTVPLRDAGVVADEWTAADLRILPKAGHWPQFEAPDTTRRMVAAFLGLPLHSSALFKPVEEDELAQINEIAQFLVNSDVGNDLTLAQRTRLAAQCQVRVFERGDMIAEAATVSDELYIIQKGYVEVWKDPDSSGGTHNQAKIEHVANLRAGQITGELAMLDRGTRSADLIAGSEGATLLALSRDRLRALVEDDSELGARFLWNMSLAMSTRVRFVLWQLNQERKGVAEQEAAFGRLPDKKIIA